MFLRYYIKLKNVFIISALIIIIPNNGQCFFVLEDIIIKVIILLHSRVILNGT